MRNPELSLNISKARVTITLEMDYISSTYVMRDYLHITEFFKQIPDLQERFEGLVEDSEDSRFKVIPSKTLFCEYFIDGKWQKSN